MAGPPRLAPPHRRAARAARRRAQPGGRRHAGRRTCARPCRAAACRSSSAPCATRITPACSATCCRAPRVLVVTVAADAARGRRRAACEPRRWPSIPARTSSSSAIRWPRWTRALGVGAGHHRGRARSSCSAPCCPRSRHGARRRRGNLRSRSVPRAPASCRAVALAAGGPAGRLRRVRAAGWRPGHSRRGLGPAGRHQARAASITGGSPGTSRSTRTT